MLKSKHAVTIGPMSVGGLWGRRLKDSVTRWSLGSAKSTTSPRDIICFDLSIKILFIIHSAIGPRRTFSFDTKIIFV